MSRFGIRGYVLAAAVAAVALTAGAARADKCAGAKLTAISKREAGLLKCQAKVAGKGDPSTQAACDGKVAAKFSAAFAKALTKRRDTAAKLCRARCMRWSGVLFLISTDSPP